MANFHVDSSGNLWLGDTSTTFTTSAPFYVTSSGAVKAASIDLTIQEEDDADGSGGGNKRIDLGSSGSKIYDFGGDIFVNANDDVIVKDVLRLAETSGSVSEPSLLFGSSSASSGSQVNPVAGLTSRLVAANTHGGNSSHLARQLEVSNGSTFVMRFNSVNDEVEIPGDIKLATSSDIYIGTDAGSNGEVLMKSGGDIVWGTVGGGSHADSDHTSFAASGHNHNSSYDNFDHIDINGLQMDSGFGLTIAGGTGISVSNSSNPHTVTITNTASSGGVTSLGDQNNSPQLTGAVQLTTTTSDGYFLSSISGNSGNGQISFNKTSYGYVNTLDPTNSNPKVGISTSDRFSNIYSQSFYGTFYGLNINASSRNIKENIVDTSLGLDFINDLPVKDFTMIDTANYGTQKYIGFIAEDLQDYLTENSLDYKLVEDYSSTYEYKDRCSHVMKCTNECECEMLQGCTCDCCSDYFPREDEDGVTKNYLHETVEDCEAYMPDENRHPHLYFNNFIGPLVKAVQELSTQVSDLTARIEALEG